MQTYRVDTGNEKIDNQNFKLYDKIRTGKG